MMNQGGNTDTIPSFDPNSLQNHQVIDASHAYTTPYFTSGSEDSAWAMHRTDNRSTENGLASNSGYHYVQHTDSQSGSVQDGSNAVPLGSSSLGAPNAPQEYNGYASYPSSTDPYGDGNTRHPNYYQGYQQHSSHSYSQPVGAYQNTGAPYQPISSFQNTGSYAGSTDYSSTYYNPGGYQTSGGYPSSGYSNQTNSWSGGNYTNYTSHQYANHAPDANDAYSSGTAPTISVQYQQHYKQWADYYSQTEVSCAPGTENMSVTSTSNLACPIPGITSGYSTSNIQPPQPFTPSESPSLQPGAITCETHDNYWKHGAPACQNHHVSPQLDFHNCVDTSHSYNSLSQQINPYPQGPNLQYPSAPQVLQSHPTPLQIVPPADTHCVSKMQIPTNPRIASNFGLGTPKSNKDSFATNAAVKPAYISVSLPKPDDKALSHDAADSMLKPVTFPTSLRGYVERALSRCKDDMQVAACQAVMKEVITKATADGTLNTRDWDTEPLFPVPDAEVVQKGLQFSAVNSSLPRQKRSPSKRSKSRWGPVPDEKLNDKPKSTNHEIYKFNGWIHSNERDRKIQSGKSEGKEQTSSDIKFPSEHKSANKNAQMPFKRQRLGEVTTAADNADASNDSDSDKEQSLAAYYPGAIALANSAEERKRRENRSKRFDKGPRHRAESNHFRPKISGAGNLYSRRASALVLSKIFEDGANGTVEDIDWDVLTVKGTCYEIEKRYLRLTAAPDPATVRPEEVLEKALTMVQNSQKNYLYKCDQLKSIRQDLTVQHIRNELTVKVYENHARLALEVGDLPEYNQCQSSLKSLYAEGIEGSHMEFSAYNLLCVILHSSNYRELLSSMSRLSDEAKNDEAVKHALAVRAAVTSGNYVLFFKLYKTAPNLNTCLMDLYVEKIRYEAVKCMSRSYRPTIPVTYIAQVLGFLNVLPAVEGSEEKDMDGVEECVEWLKAHGACLIADTNGEMQLDTKASSSNLYMPEPDDAVAHGDANLAVNDFFTRTS